MSMTFLNVQNLARRYPAGRGGQPLTVFDRVSFGLEKGEFVCIIGHSGCGKSTILNILAGLDSASEGVVVMDGREIGGPSLNRGVIFQNHSLLPWKSALKNVVFAVRARWPDWSKEQILAHSLRYLELVGLVGAEHRTPSQLSGGMRQRVGIARAFAIEPKLLLMDEPFGALDALTRGMIQEELVRIWERTQQTVFMITHDVDEAILLSDRVLLMTNGPHARVAESVKVDIPRPRNRSDIIHHAGYYTIRNYLVDFLVRRSKEITSGTGSGTDPAASHSPVLIYPKEVNPLTLTVVETSRVVPHPLRRVEP
jgi:nitrate/nitrite transport system ATP-binding protein